MNIRHLAVLGLVLLTATAARAADYAKVDIAASPAGGAWYVGLGSYAKALTDLYPEFEVSLFPGGSNANVLRVAKGASQIGATMVANMKAALDGKEPYKAPVSDVMALANIHDVTRLHFMVPADSKIQSLRQIAEQKMPFRLGTGTTGGNAELFARWVLEEYGISYKAIKEWGGGVYHLTSSESQTRLQENQLDLHTWMGPGESFIYQELIKTRPIRFLDVDEDVLARVIKKYGLARGTIPVSFYGGPMGRDVTVVVSSAGLVVRRDLPDDMVYKFARALDLGARDIAVALPAWNTITPATMCQGLPLELHPGAIQYYKENGCLK